MRTASRVEARRGFTLAELLAVMVIMAMIVGITLASFNSVRGTPVSVGGRQLHSALRLARQHAITKRRPVAVLVCDPGYADSYMLADEASSNLLGCAYAVFDLKDNKYVHPWEKLPGNLVFNPDTAPSGVGENVLAEPRTSSEYILHDIPFPHAYSTGAAFRAEMYGVRFLPDGRSPQEGVHHYHWLFVSEGLRRGTDVSVKPGALTMGLRVSPAGGVKMESYD